MDAPGGFAQVQKAGVEPDVHGADIARRVGTGSTLIDLGAGKLAYSSYGHPSQYARSASDGRIFELDSLTTLLGPCGRLWPSETRCIVTPDACEKHPN